MKLSFASRLLVGIARGFIAAVQCLPLEWVARIGRAGGGFAWWVDRRHRRIALENLERALGSEYDTRTRRAIARENFRRLGESYLCALKTPVVTPAEFEARVEIGGFAEAMPVDGRCIIVAIGHFGNFELFARAKRLMPEWTVATTYRALRQPGLNALFQTLRSTHNILYFERRTEAQALKETLGRGRVILGILADQHAGDRGLWLPFFGHDCSCSAAPAVFARRYGGILHTAVCFRTGLARWRLEMGPQIPTTHPDGTLRSSEELTRDINAAYEVAIRRDPANWFWVHRRWKPPSARQLAREAAADSEPASDPA